MRSAFGKYCEELRVQRKMTQSEFSRRSGYSLSRISNIEYQRSNISDDVIGVYISVLDCSGEECCNLRKLAEFSNGLRRHNSRSERVAPLQTMLEQFRERISPDAVKQIQKILERETGEQLEKLCFSSNQGTQGQTKKRRARRPDLSPERFVEIALRALEVRRCVCNDFKKVEIDWALQVLSTREDNLDFKIDECLPTYLDGAFACIVGHADGHTILVEQSRFLQAINGVLFSRHAVGHELAHHFLHAHLLQGEKEVVFEPQELAKNSAKEIGTDRQIEQVVDNIVEAEAECFATLFLVPWEAFLKGTHDKYLASDYGEQQREVERYSRYFRNPAVLDAFRSALWTSGIKRHPIFDYSPK